MGEALGVARQESDCRALCDARGWEVADVYVDNDLSAYSGKPRPAFRRLLADVTARRVGAVVAYHADRLYRHPRDLEALVETVEAAGAKMATVAAGDFDLATASGRMVARMLGAAARGESERASERIRRQRMSQVEQGKRQGGGKRPFGFEADGVTHRLDEADAVRQAAHDLLTGASVYRVAQEWNARGLLSPSGNRWSTGTLSALMRQPSLAGIRRHEPTGTEAKAAWDPIITVAEHQMLKRRLATTGVGVRQGRRRALLSGIARCAECGSKLLVTEGRYVCDRSRGRGCGKTRVAQGRELELAVLKLLDSPRFKSKPTRQRRRDDVRRDKLLTELAAIEERSASLAADYGSGDLTRTEFNAARAAAQRRRGEVETELAELGEPSVDYIEARDDALNTWLNGADLTPDGVALLQEPMRAALPGGAIYVKPAAKWSRGFDPARLEVRD
jgi:DNA invertase Pin-like site-specific DNA recombinase